MKGCAVMMERVRTAELENTLLSDSDGRLGLKRIVIKKQNQVKNILFHLLFIKPGTDRKSVV